MLGILKKSLIKWSAIAFLGISAYFLGYFWGVKNPGNEVSESASLRMRAAETSDQPADLSKLKERVH